MKISYFLFLVLPFTLGADIYRDILQFVQKLRKVEFMPVDHIEYVNLRFPHPTLKKKVDEMYAQVISRNHLDVSNLVSFFVFSSEGVLLPINYTNNNLDICAEIKELQGYFEKDKIDKSKLHDMIKRKGNILNLFKNNLNDPIDVCLAAISIDALDIAKRIKQYNKVNPIFTTFNIPYSSKYAQNIADHLKKCMPLICLDRKNSLPEILYLYTMFFYVECQAALQHNFNLASECKQSMDLLVKSYKSMNVKNSLFNDLPDVYQMRIAGAYETVSKIRVLSFPQLDISEDDYCSCFIKDNAITITIAESQVNRVPDLLTKLYDYFLGNKYSDQNPFFLSKD